MKPTTCVAFDLGAESGRAILGTFEEGSLSMKEVHRFSNGPVNILGHLHWDIFRLFEEMKKGLRAALAAALLCADRGAEPGDGHNASHGSGPLCDIRPRSEDREVGSQARGRSGGDPALR